MKHASYDPKEIESKWQKYWEEKGIFHAKTGSKKKKFYALVEFPYPSGDGLHVGHVRPYVALDSLARKRRMEGYEVLYPFGWDAFGLPTENYAVKHGIHPEVVTKKNTDNFRQQVKNIGISFDWSREINTTDPAYYKWTQWIFLQLFKNGLAYKAKMDINWCPSCRIGLANEEAIGGVCERCGGPTGKREKEQWMLAITKYADRLDRDLDMVDYPDRVKTQQRNWIGKSEGTRIKFNIQHSILENDTPWAGVGFLIQDTAGKFLFQRRDMKTARDSGMVTPFGGGKHENESPDECVKRECREELGISLVSDQITFIGDFPSKNTPGETIKMFFVSRVSQRSLKLHEGEEIASLTPKEALLSENVSEFTKEVLRFYQSQQERYIEVFTTRVDTIFGCTYVVVAPEHESIKRYEARITNYGEVKKYLDQVKKKTEQDRLDATKEKTGVKLEGIEVINPFTGESVPIFVADYVLGNYGTGAVMAVPAHDERDWEFAKKYVLPMRSVVAPYVVVTGDDAPRSNKEVFRFNAETAIVKHWEKDLYYVVQFKTGQRGFVGGKVEDGENLSEAIQREVMEESGYSDMNVERCLFRHAYARGYKSRKSREELAHEAVFVVRLKSGKRVEIMDHAIKDGIWLAKEDILQSNLFSHHRYYFEHFLKDLDAYTDDGVLVDSGEFTGLHSDEVREKMTAWLEKEGLGKRQTNYKLRDWVFSRQRYWGEPIPLVFCAECKKRTDNKQRTTNNEGEALNPGWVAVPEEELPLKLPVVESYVPTETGESPLAAMEEWVATTCSVCWGPARRETDTMPNWAGSSWYYLRYTDPKNDRALASQEALEYWMKPSVRNAPTSADAGGVDWYNGGMEHTTLHLLYSRFWHKFLYDIGVVPTAEPYAKRTSHGLILAEGGVKMSKSKGNVVNPDDIVRRFGADTLRVYEMFMGPFEQAVAWSEESIAGARRFLEKVWKLQRTVNKQPTTNNKQTRGNDKRLLRIALHKTIKKVSEDIEAMRFNTAISALMILVNEMEKADSILQEDFETLLLLLSPFAPHMAEELWNLVGNAESILSAKWPQANQKYLVADEVEVVVQINGKLRARLRVAAGSSQEEVESAARRDALVVKYLEGREIRKTIFVQDRLVNFVVG